MKRNRQLVAQIATNLAAQCLSPVMSGGFSAQGVVDRAVECAEQIEAGLTARYLEASESSKRNVDLLLRIATNVVSHNLPMVVVGQTSAKSLVNQAFEFAEKLEAVLSEKFAAETAEAKPEGEAASQATNQQAPQAPVPSRTRPKKPEPVTPPSDPPAKVFLDTSVENLGLPDGTVASLKQAGLVTVSHILDYEKVKAAEGGITTIEGIADGKRAKVLEAIEAKRTELGAPAE